VNNRKKRIRSERQAPNTYQRFKKRNSTGQIDASSLASDLARCLLCRQPAHRVGVNPFLQLGRPRSRMPIPQPPYLCTLAQYLKALKGRWSAAVDAQIAHVVEPSKKAGGVVTCGQPGGQPAFCQGHKNVEEWHSD